MNPTVVDSRVASSMADAARPAGKIDGFLHALDGKPKPRKPLTIKEMNAIAAAGWAGQLGDE